MALARQLLPRHQLEDALEDMHSSSQAPAPTANADPPHATKCIWSDHDNGDISSTHSSSDGNAMIWDGEPASAFPSDRTELPEGQPQCIPQTPQSYAYMPSGVRAPASSASHDTLSLCSTNSTLVLATSSAPQFTPAAPVEFPLPSQRSEELPPQSPESPCVRRRAKVRARAKPANKVQKAAKREKGKAAASGSGAGQMRWQKMALDTTGLQLLAEAAEIRRNEERESAKEMAEMEEREKEEEAHGGRWFCWRWLMMG
ncbi:hypothetical protein CERZMDRAFT_88082 [Cercospora zeae-maydis SCOH1-5]|uniref:Uncharacterized protein n=1 Tax=Cercospora zeae-maydis SCOH1-5 TaxID=717836 RepID=A0A6A6F2P1_9PEZI|nr:hypothetical protein CERZMDRAFT_88082 [Cercospora zeae-maydis SCOH1-5]